MCCRATRATTGSGAAGGRDQLFGGIDDDELISIDMDANVDQITCGAGFDRVVKRASDQIMDPVDCERVIVVRLR